MTRALASRPLRRDAELNLARILEAARDVFAEQGYEASMEEIAERAEVGVGTLYRRFPCKADLFEAVVDEARTRTRQIAEEVLAEVPAEEAVFEFLRRCIAVPSCWRATISTPPWSGDARTALERMAPVLEQILERSRAAGAVRDDVGVADLVIALLSARGVADLCDRPVPGSSARFLELVLDGLRPGHASPAQGPMTVKQLGRIFRSC